MFFFFSKGTSPVELHILQTPYNLGLCLNIGYQREWRGISGLYMKVISRESCWCAGVTPPIPANPTLPSPR